MNKVTGDLIRNVLKIGGTVLVTTGVLPATCSITSDPQLTSIAGAIVTLGGVAWGVIQANHHQALKEQVDGTA